jgi:hypothetical protein
MINAKECFTLVHYFPIVTVEGVTMGSVVPLAFNQRLVVCQQQSCEYVGKERVASMPLVGMEIFIDGMVVVCKCGFAPIIVEIG